MSEHQWSPFSDTPSRTDASQRDLGPGEAYDGPYRFDAALHNSYVSQRAVDLGLANDRVLPDQSDVDGSVSKPGTEGLGESGPHSRIIRKAIDALDVGAEAHIAGTEMLENLNKEETV